MSTPELFCRCASSSRKARVLSFRGQAVKLIREILQIFQNFKFEVVDLDLESSKLRVRRPSRSCAWVDIGTRVPTPTQHNLVLYRQ